MVFYGLQKLSMVDYPGLLAATVFTGGCNLRCPFCHNALLVHADAPAMEEAEVLSFLEKRRGFLDAVVLSGGEPLLHPGAGEFLKKVKAMGFRVKLDTNGCYPHALAALLESGTLDYVAMDIKNCPEKYPLTAGCPGLSLEPVEKSIRLLRESGVAYEFRTTVVKEFHEQQDILSICRWLAGSRRWGMQKFVDSGNLLQDGLHSVEDAVMQSWENLAKPFFSETFIRGIG